VKNDMNGIFRVDLLLALYRGGYWFTVMQMLDKWGNIWIWQNDLS